LTVAFVIFSLGCRRFYLLVIGDLRRRRGCRSPAMVNLVRHRWGEGYGRRMLLACVAALTTMTNIVGDDIGDGADGADVLLLLYLR